MWALPDFVVTVIVVVVIVVVVVVVAAAAAVVVVVVVDNFIVVIVIDSSTYTKMLTLKSITISRHSCNDNNNDSDGDQLMDVFKQHPTATNNNKTH